MLQDIIKEHTEEVLDVTFHFIKMACKISLPLAGSLLFFSITYFIDYGNSASNIISHIF